jgi:hypothetical protein
MTQFRIVGMFERSYYRTLALAQAAEVRAEAALDLTGFRLAAVNAGRNGHYLIVRRKRDNELLGYIREGATA